MVHSSSTSTCSHSSDKSSSIQKHSFSSLRKTMATTIETNSATTTEAVIEPGTDVNDVVGGGLMRENSTESPRSFVPRCYDNELVTPATTPSGPESAVIEGIVI